MGERTDGMMRQEDRAAGRPGSSRRIEEELSTLRGEIGNLLGELDRRRRELFDLRLQVRRHPVAIPLAVLALGVILTGSVALRVRRKTRRRRTAHQARQLWRALGRMADHPERVGRGEPTPGEKILVAIGTTAATLLVKRALELAVPRPGKKVVAAPGT